MVSTNSTSNQQLHDLVELNEELENYFSNTIIPQLFVDAQLILRKFTPPAMKQFSFSPDHIGRPMVEMVDHIRYSTITENIQQVIDTGQILEKEIQTTDMRWFQMNIIPYLIKKRNITNGVIITFVDITDRINILRELEKLNASHETFIYAVSHDLKAPLANIESLVQLLMETSSELLTEEAANNQEQQKIADLLNQSVVSMRHILNDLAEITKIEGNYREKVETIRFMDLIQEVEWTLKDQIQTSQAHIQVDLQESEIGFSRKNLRSILYNFLSNALKYQSPDRIPIISIKTEKMEGQVFLSVQDNGVGITAEKKELLFNRFTRLKSNVEGTGIGLYLVKKIMENAGGTIAVESAPGVGSMFQVSFSMPA